MPIYEYEPEDGECWLCNGRMEIMQGIHEPALTTCPKCGLDVKRVVSKPSFRIDSTVSPEKAGERGFTTFKKVGKGQYEKVGGEGPETLDAAKLDDIQ